MRAVYIYLAILLFLSSPAVQAIDHGQFISTTFRSGEDVTRFSIKCHRKEADEFIKTPHWRWKGPPKLIEGLEDSRVEYGKINLLNNFCISIEGGPDWKNLEHCAECHAGYGFTGRDFDFTDITKIDCLVCHEQTGYYERGDGARPVFPVKGYEGKFLKRAAASVDRPARKNCGSCHFYGGSGNGVKHGDLDSSLINPSRELDVHMALDGLNMACQDCHKTRNHRISGASTFLATYDGRVFCEDCHGDRPHDPVKKKTATLNGHVKKVACQTCHIPFIARDLPTQISWDWSTVGRDIKSSLQFGMETYKKHQGTFQWGKNLIPEYAWYRGKIKRYLRGEKVADREGPVYISRPVGYREDGASRIYPFKTHRGRQPMDSVYQYLLIPHLVKGLWKHYDWERALGDGAKGSGLPYSGKYEFVTTIAYGSINHQVAPKEKALRCHDCHSGNGRLDWKALGYGGDPLKC